MKLIIRIRGLIGINKNIKATLDRLRLRKKYSCIVVRETPEILGMLRKIRNFVAYGDIDKEILKELIEKRGKAIGGKKADGEIDAERIANEFFEGKSRKKLNDFGIKPFFRLHPPRKGIKAKLHYPKGVLGDHKDKIKDLIMRML